MSRIAHPFTIRTALSPCSRHAPTTPQFHTGTISISIGVDDTASEPLRLRELMQRMIDGVDVHGNADPNGKRFLFTVAAGNSCNGNPIGFYPALFGPIDGVVAVGFTRANTLWEGSCTGPEVDVLAPAENMLVAAMSGVDRYRYRFGNTNVMSGTSYAAPYVAGIAARMLELNPRLTPVQLEAQLKASASRAADLPVPVIRYVQRRRAVR